MGIVSTGFVGVDQATDDLVAYAVPNVVTTPSGNTVAYGAEQTLTDGQTLGAGTYKIVSGTLAAEGTVTYQEVTIT